MGDCGSGDHIILIQNSMTRYGECLVMNKKLKWIQSGIIGTGLLSKSNHLISRHFKFLFSCVMELSYTIIFKPTIKIEIKLWEKNLIRAYEYANTKPHFKYKK